MHPEANVVIVCPGCGWVGTEVLLKKDAGFKSCPECDYQNGMAPHRLLTVKEMMEFPQEGDYKNVDLYAFLNAIAPFLQDSLRAGS